MHKQTIRSISKTLTGILVLMGGSAAMADTLVVPDFAASTAATAASVNTAFEAVESSVNDNDARITTNTGAIGTNTANIADNFSSTTSNTTDITNNFNNLDQRVSSIEVDRWDFSGYWIDFPAQGQPANVVLLGRYDFDDTLTGYYIRWSSNNNGDQISVNGVLTTRQYIFHYSFVGIDPNDGSINFISESIESPDTEEYLTFLAEESVFDSVSLVKTIQPDGDTLRGTESCGYSVVQICVVQYTLSSTGAFHSIYDYSRGRVLATNVNIGGGWPVFTDVRLEKSFGSGRLRIRAKGIGTIYQRYDSGYDRLLYHRNDGVTGGSLAGTPFDTGQPLDGLFF